MTYLAWRNALWARTRGIIGASAKVMLIGACENSSLVWSRLLVDDVLRSTLRSEVVALAGKREGSRAQQLYHYPPDRGALCKIYDATHKPRKGPPAHASSAWRRYLSFPATA